MVSAKNPKQNCSQEKKQLFTAISRLYHTETVCIKLEIYVSIPHEI